MTRYPREPSTLSSELRSTASSSTMRTVTGAAPMAFHDGRAGSGKQVTEVTWGLTLPQKGASVSEGGAGGRIGPGGPTGLHRRGSAPSAPRWFRPKLVSADIVVPPWQLTRQRRARRSPRSHVASPASPPYIGQVTRSWLS